MNEVTALLVYYGLLFDLKRHKTVCHGRLKDKRSSALKDLNNLRIVRVQTRDKTKDRLPWQTERQKIRCAERLDYSSNS
jgi:hypothetical protein